MFTNDEIREICKRFDLPGTYLSFAPITEGYINNTLTVSFDDGGKRTRYILQQINTSVFRDPETLMKNVVATTEHIRKKAERDPECTTMKYLVCFPTREGGAYYTDEKGRVWRVYNYIENSVSYNLLDSAELFYKTAKGFGEYADLLSDFPMALLGETIPDFHNTEKRYETFLEAVRKNASGRRDRCEKEIAFVTARKAYTSAITEKLASGEVPARVTHNDTKLNNILFDKDTDEPVCVVDLDTVMPGSALYDFGDAIRSGASTAAEDEKDLDKVRLNLTLYEAFVRGYLEKAGHSLTETEIHMLGVGARTITLECGMRFLTDYLDGDVYFRTSYPEQNLDRCRTQFKLVSEMEAHFDEMNEIVERVVRGE